MSQKNVEIVRRVFEAAVRRDRSVLALYHPEVEWGCPWANLDYRHGELIDGAEHVIASRDHEGRDGPVNSCRDSTGLALA